MHSSPIETQIDLVNVAKTIWTGKRKIIFFVVGFAIFGIVLAFLTPKEFSSKTIWVNQSESTFTGNSSFEGIAAMVGFDMQSMDGTNELTPVDYPDFIESLSFQYDLMHTPLKWAEFEDSMSLFTYYSEYYRPGPLKTVWSFTFGLPGRFLNMGKREVPAQGRDDRTVEQSPRRLSETEVWVRYILLDKVELTLNDGNNIVTLEVKTPDPVASAELARAAERLLKEKVTELIIDKAKKSLAFTKRLYEDKKTDFKEAQDKLAQYRDRNLNLGSERARKEEEILLSEYQIAFSVYSEMASELETAKIRVEEDTPMFSVVEEATIPLIESKPKKVNYLLIWGFLGGFLGLIWVLAGPLLTQARHRWKELDE